MPASLSSRLFIVLTAFLVVRDIALLPGPQRWLVSLFLAACTVNCCYMMVMGVVLSPLIYLARNWTEACLGPVEAERLKAGTAAD